jgi:alanine racemase
VPAEGIHRPAWAEISRSALAHNVTTVRAVVGEALICAVVKANGYGHGALLVAPALLEAGADLLAVAIVDEGIELRSFGITAPILLLAEIPADTLGVALEHDLTVTVGSLGGARAVADVARALGGRYRVHLKIDTGMYRQGVDPADALEAARLLDTPHLTLEGLYTHFPVADGASDDDRSYTQRQMATFGDVVTGLAGAGITPPLVHLANSAGALGHPDSSAGLVRPGLALYGYTPAGWLSDALDARGLSLRPALSLRAHVVAARDVAAGERPSYGRRRPLAVDSRIVTVPFGYADGYPRRLFDAGASVLIGGQRFALAGSVTMDQLLVNVGDADVNVGDDVVLLGRDGDVSVSAEDWASWASTITWEILCGISARVPRVLVD